MLGTASSFFLNPKGKSLWRQTARRSPPNLRPYTYGAQQWPKPRERAFSPVTLIGPSAPSAPDVERHYRQRRGRGMKLNIVIFGLSITSSWGNGHATTYRALAKALSTCAAIASLSRARCALVPRRIGSGELGLLPCRSILELELARRVATTWSRCRPGHPGIVCSRWNRARRMAHGRARRGDRLL